MEKRKRFVPIWMCLLFNLITAGHIWGFYEAFATNNPREIDAAFRNYPILLLIIVVSVGSWFLKI